MLGQILLLGLGYLASIFIAVYILSFAFPGVKGDDHGWLVVGSIAWPVTIIVFTIIGVVFAIIFGPGLIGARIHNIGERHRQRIKAYRQKRREGM